jgi:hypothetical protein
MDTKQEVNKRIQEWVSEYYEGARKSLSKIYDSNEDYIDRQILDGTEFLGDMLVLAEETVFETVTRDWDQYQSSGLAEKITLEEFARLRGVIRDQERD